MDEKRVHNLRFYTDLREVPPEAQKQIAAGRLKGMTDVNPMWRDKAITEEFGPCGFGWRYEIVSKEFKYCEKTGETACFVDVNFYYRDPESGEWSAAIPGTGGSKFCAQERNGAYCSDECYKMALTDALSVTYKRIGTAADIYFKNDVTKYTAGATPAKAQQQEPEKPRCWDCKKPLSALKFTSGKSYTLEEAQREYGGLCYSCWKKRQAAQREAQSNATT